MSDVISENASEISKPKKNDNVIDIFNNLFPADKVLINARVSGDIPFLNYRSMFLSSPKQYLKFLKKLQKSQSRHDLLFLLFDCVAGGEDLHNLPIKAHELDETVRRMSKNAPLAVEACCGFRKFSSYLILEYPQMFNQDFLTGGNEPVFTSYPNDEKLFEFRRQYKRKFNDEKFLDCRRDSFFRVHPLRKVRSSDRPEEPMVETSFGGRDSLKEKHQSFFSFYHYFIGLFKYVGEMPGTADSFILFDFDPYKRIQIETIMKKRIEKGDLVEYGLVRKCDGKMVIIAEERELPTTYENSFDDDEAVTVYKRAKIISTENENQRLALLLDYGKCVMVDVSQIYTYPFDRHYPDILTRIVPKNKLPPTFELNDMFVFDVTTKKFVFVGKKSVFSSFCDIRQQQNSANDSVPPKRQLLVRKEIDKVKIQSTSAEKLDETEIHDLEKLFDDEADSDGDDTKPLQFGYNRSWACESSEDEYDETDDDESSVADTLMNGDGYSSNEDEEAALALFK